MAAVTRLLATGLLAVWLGPAGAAEPGALAGPELVAALRAGGHVLYLRHGATEARSAPEVPGADQCAHQRPLSAEGRAQAAAIGAAVRRLGLPIGDVLATTFCRAGDTARLAFGRVTVARDLFATGTGPGGERVRYAGLRRFLATAPPAGVNAVLVGHAPPFKVVAGAALAEGEAAVVEPLGAGGFRVIARVPVGEWEHLEVAR